MIKKNEKKMKKVCSANIFDRLFFFFSIKKWRKSIMKKHFPVGTFVGTPIRVLAILQLCVIFTYLGWVGGYPFLGELYEIKVSRTKFESVLEDKHWKELSEERRAAILEGYNELEGRASVPLSKKIETSMRILFVETAIYDKVWIVLSIILPIFLLLRVEGAISCVWLLPILVSLGFIGSLGRTLELSEEEKLFPTEAELIERYIGKPLEGGFLEQKEQLQKGWEMYLLEKWVGGVIAVDEEVQEEQKSRGQFFFNVARVEAVMRDGLHYRNPTGSGLWLLSFIWSLGWAGGISVYDYWTRRKNYDNLAYQRK
jgi:hypothetical protein